MSTLNAPKDRFRKVFFPAFRNKYERFGDCMTNQEDPGPWKCVFPFTYRGKKYDACTGTASSSISNAGNPPRPWCALEVDAKEEFVPGKWVVGTVPPA